MRRTLLPDHEGQSWQMAAIAATLVRQKATAFVGTVRAGETTLSSAVATIARSARELGRTLMAA